MKNLAKIIEGGFCLWVFILPWQTRLIFPAQINGGYWEYGSASLYATELLLWAVLGVFGIWLWHQPRRKVSWPELKTRLQQPAIRLYWLMVGLMLWSLASTFWSLNPALSWYAAFKLIEAGALVALVVNFPLRLPVLATAWVSSRVLQSLLGIWQFFVQRTDPNKWLGLAAHDATIGGSIVLESATERWLRAYGSLPHPNILGGFLVVALLLAFFLGLVTQSRRYRRLLLGAVVLITPGLFFTFSRSAWVALGVSLAVLAGWLMRRSSVEQRRVFLELLGIVAFITLILGLLFQGPLLARLYPHQRIELDSLKLRLTFTQQAKTVIANTLPLGTGVGAYTFGVYKFVNSAWPSWYYQPVHLVPLLVLAELGPIGLALALVLVGGLVIATLRRQLGITHIVLFAAWLGMIVISFFDHYFWSLYVGVMMFWLVFGLNIRLLRDQKNNVTK